MNSRFICGCKTIPPGVLFFYQLTGLSQRLCTKHSISELEHICNPRYQPGVSQEPGEGQEVNHQRKLETLSLPQVCTSAERGTDSNPLKVFSSVEPIIRNFSGNLCEFLPSLRSSMVLGLPDSGPGSQSSFLSSSIGCSSSQ